MKKRVRKVKSDYTREMLPHNRKEVFWDVLKLQWKSLLFMGVILFVFSLPLLVSAIVEDVYITSVYDSLPQNATIEQQQVAAYSVLTFSSVKSFVEILFYIVFAIGLAGVSRIIRQFCWGENVFFASDFSLGLKQNVKQYVWIALIGGFLFAISIVCANFSSIISDSILSIILYFPILLFILVVLPIVGLILTMIPIYSGSLLKRLRIAFVVFAQKPLVFIAALICCLLPYFVCVIPNTYCHILGRIVGAIILPFVLLGWNLFCYNRLDEVVNKKYYPDIVGKGTY